MSGQTRVTIAHIRSSKLCMRGARRWFEHHGLSWDEFLESGIDIEVAKKVDDPMARRVVAEALKGKSDG